MADPRAERARQAFRTMIAQGATDDELQEFAEKLRAQMAAENAPELTHRMMGIPEGTRGAGPWREGYVGATEQPKEPESPGIPAAIGYGVARGASLGFVDRLAGLGGYLGDKLSSKVNDIPENPNAYAEERADYLAREDEAKKAHGGFYAAGEVGGGIFPTIA